MRLRLRLLWLFIVSLWRQRLQVFDELVLSFTVLPNDVDVSKLSDDRYFAIADLGRVGLALRMGIAPVLFRRKWVPLATVASIRFRHPLKLFQRYQLLTRMVCWDDDSFYLRQAFLRHRRIVATAYVCATFLSPDGPVRPADVLAAIHQPVASPEPPAIVRELQALGTRLRDEQRDRPGEARAAG